MKSLKRMLLTLKTVVPVLFIFVCISCSNTDGQPSTAGQNQNGDKHIHSETDDHDDHAHDLHDHGHDGKKSSTVTVWEDRFEIFMEHPFVVENTPTEFVTHITDRTLLQPRRKGPVTFVVTDESGASTKHVEPSPERDGIYIPKLTFPQSGRWRMSLVIAVNENEYTVELPALNVYSSQDEADRAQTPDEVSGISFLKEQQWKIPFETKEVQRRTIHSQDVLAVPTMAVIDEGRKPAVFIQLAGETFAKRYLRLGEKEDGFIQIVAGLSEGEYVVTQGANAVAETEHRKGHDDHDHEGHDDHDDHDDSMVKLSDEEMKRFGIEVGKVKAGDIALHIKVPGEIVINSDRLAHIVPRVSGIVQEVKKNLGDIVKEGEVMAIIESRELADVKAAYLTSIEAYRLAEPYFKREEKLWGKKISSEQEYLDAKKALSEATIEMNKAKYKLRALGLSLEYIESLTSESAEQFTTYKISAPFNGTIIEKHITLGEVISEDDDIFVVANLDTVWVDLRVPQKDASSIKKGQKVTISGKSDTTKIEDTIDYVHSLIDEQTRTKLARVVLDNTSGQFLPGTFVTANVQVGESESDVIVNKSVLQNIDDKACVFVQSAQGFEPRPVIIGRSNETCVEIIDGLESGEIIVTENSFRIKAQLEKAAAGEQTGHGHSH
jgi:cobalt-zinc-cadmium efflux system membrane fusion protein